MNSDFTLVQDHCTSFNEIKLQNVNQFYVKCKSNQQQNTSTSVSYQKEVKKNVHKKYITPRKDHNKQKKKQLQYFPFFRQLEKQKLLKKQSRIFQKTIFKISKRIKKKICLHQTSNMNPKIKIYPKKDSDIELSILRKKIYDWLMEVCQVLQFSRQSFHKCLNLFQKLPNVQKKKAQLTATTCLFMIAKLEQNTHRIQIFSQITQQSCKINQIKERELEILLELKFKINSHTIFTQMENILILWDQFLTNNLGIIQFNISKFKTLDKSFMAIKNFLQLCIFIDYFRMHGILPNDHYKILIICGIFIITGLDIGQFTFEELQTNKLKYGNYSLTNILISGFLKEYFSQICIQKIHKYLKMIGPKSSILKLAPQIYEKVTNQLEQNKFQTYKQLYFNGLIF